MAFTLYPMTKEQQMAYIREQEKKVQNTAIKVTTEKKKPKE